MESIAENSIVPLLSWDVLRSSEMKRHKYSVRRVINSPAEVKPEVIYYAAYIRGISWPEQRCQEYFYFSVRGHASVVCSSCLPAARFSLFSVFEDSTIQLIHSHIKSVVMCLFCNQRIPAFPINNCTHYKNVDNIVKYCSMYKCKWSTESRTKRRKMQLS